MPEEALRERLVALEVEMRHMRESGDRQAAELHDLRAAVGELKDLLTQVKGARWAIMAAIGVGGLLASYLPSVLKWAVALTAKAP